MQIQISTNDKEFAGVDEGMVRDAVLGALDRFGERVIRVQVHVRDVNGPKAGQIDKQCTMEARLAGRQPVAVTADGPSVQQVVHDAAMKLERRIDNDLGKVSDRRS